MYKHQSSGQKAGLNVVGIGLCIMVICIIYLSFLIDSTDHLIPSLLNAPMSLIVIAFLMIGAFITYFGAQTALRGGYWHIEVSDQGVTWLNPENNGFQYSKPEIARIEILLQSRRRLDGKTEESRRYRLVSAKGENHELSLPPKLDITVFLAAVDSLGIEIQEISI